MSVSTRPQIGFDAAGARRALGVDEARRVVLKRFESLSPVVQPLAGVCGLVLAEDVMSTETVPPFANSAMDGFALRSADVVVTPARLEVVATVMAGDAVLFEIGRGQAVRIMTGAPLPIGADAVCPFERAPLSDHASVLIECPIEPGTNVRFPGEDIKSGDVVFQRGTPLGPAAIGVLASLGLMEVLVHPMPVVGVLSTGDELVEGPSPLPVGKIRDANRPALCSAIQREGFVVIDLGIIGDDEDSLATALENAGQRCDAVVLSAGVSAGDRDIVGDVLRELCGGDYEQLSIGVRPGKPLAVGTLVNSHTPVVGLPGNPVAAMAGFELFVRPGLRRLAGQAALERPLLAAISDQVMRRNGDGKVHVIPTRTVVRDGELHIIEWGQRGSHQLHSLATCNALGVIADGSGIEVGERVFVMLLEDTMPDGLSVLERPVTLRGSLPS